MTVKSVQSNNPFKSVMLTIYDIVKAHGGMISVESEAGKGTEFKIQLPQSKS